FKLEHAEAEQIQPTIDQVARSLVTGTRGRVGRAPTVIADRNLNALHVLAEREQMNRIEAVIQELDVDVPEDEWHFVELMNITASDAARMIAPILDGGAVSQPRRPARGRRGPVRALATSQAIPLDEANTLIVICSAEEWEKAEKILKIADENAVSNRPEIQFFAVENGNAQSIASTVMQLYGNYQHPVLGRSRTFVDTLGQQIVVQGVKPALEEIESLVKSLDVVPEENPIVILPLEHAEATQVAQIAQGLLPPEVRVRGGRRSAGGPTPSLQAEPVTNSLIIQADRQTVERVNEFAAEMDAKVAAQKPVRQFYSLKNAAPRDVVSAIVSLFGGTGGGRRFPRGPVGTQVKAVIVGNQVVVDAPSIKQAEIAALVQQLDEMEERGITTVLVKMPGANVQSIAQRLTRAFQPRVQKQGLIARFEADSSTETILMTVAANALEEAQQLLEEYKELTSEMVWETKFQQLQHATANQAAGWLREQLVAMVTQQIGSSAARQIKVTGDQRTNRVFVNAPSVAVKQGLLLLEQYDQASDKPPETPIEVWTVKLMGLDVRGLSSQLQRAVNNLTKGRPDRLRAVISADQMTNNLIISAPRDLKDQVSRLIDDFTAETADLVPVQKFIRITEADASYIATQVSNLLNIRITRQRGAQIARQVSVQVDTRLNRIILNAPKFAIEMAEALVAELDKEPIESSQIQTLALQNADANTVLGVLRTIFNEKIRARTLQISVEPLTNSLIVGATKEDFEEISKWATDLDEKARDAVTEQRIFELKNANPWEVNGVLQQTFVQKRRGVRQTPGKEVKVAIIAGRSIFVTAPPEKMEEIGVLITKLDEVGKNQMVVRNYKMPGLGTQLTQFARQIQNAVNGQLQPREPRISITALPAADTLIVTAVERKLPEVEEYMEQFKKLYTPHKIETIPLLNGDANMVYQALNRVLQPKIRAGKIQLGVEGLTNSLIVSAAEEEMAEIREWVAKYEQEAQIAIVPPRIFELKNANPWEVRGILQTTFTPPGGARRRGSMEIRFDILGGRSIVAKAPAEKMKQIEELINRLDEVVSNKAKVVSYEVPGMGTRLTQFGRDIERAVNSQVQARDRRISVIANTAADVLIVTAMEDQFKLIRDAMEQFGQFYEPTRIETIELLHADANMVYQALNRVLGDKIRAGKMQLSVEPMTNSLIVVAAEKELEEIRQWATNYDTGAEKRVSPPKIIRLKNANPWEVRGILTTTFVQRSGRARSGGKDIRVEVMGGSSLVVYAPAGKMEQIETLVAQLEEVGSNKAEVRTFEVPGMGSRLNEFARQIQNAVNTQVPVRERRISVTAYPAADVLIVTALPDQFEMIQQAMDKFKELYEPARIETISLQNGDANTVYNSLRTVLQQKIRAGKIQISVEPMTNSLVVLAAEEELAEIREWTAKFDEAAAQAISPPRIFELKNANPWEVRNVLNTTYLSGGRGRRQAGKEVRFDVIGGRSIVAMAPAEKMKEVEALIAKLDEVGGHKTIVRTYELPGMGNRLNDLARQVRDAVNAGMQARERRISVTAYPPADALIVTATVDQFERVEQMMEQFKPLLEIAKFVTEFFKLEYVDAGQIVGPVQNLVRTSIRTRGKSSRGTQDFSVSADPRTNRLIVFAPESIMPEVREMVEQLDIEVEEDNVVTIELKYADPWETRNMINDVFGSRTRRRGQASAQDVYVTVSNNQLVIKAPPKKLEQIEALIAKIDAEDTGGLQIKTYDLKVLNAQTVAAQVQMFLRSMGRVGKRGQMQPGAFAEPTTNTLVVIAPAEHLPFIETLIAQIEAKTPDEAISQQYVLKNARADQVQRHVDQMLRAKIAEREGATRGRTTQQRTAVMADPETNRLFVFAPPDYQELAAELVKMVDEEVDTGEIIHIIPLENGDAAQVAQTVTQMLQGGGPRGRGAAPMKVKVVPDPGSNSILLSGLPKDVAEVETLVKELEAASEMVPELQYFVLEYAMPFEVAEALRGIFPPSRNPADNVTVTEDEYNNRLLVATNRRKMRQVEAIIAQLDAAPEEGEGDLLAGGKQLYFIDVYRGDPWDIAMELEDFFPPPERGGPTIEAPWFGDYLTVICRPSEYPKIERLIRQFEKRAKLEIVIRAIDFTGDRQRLLQYLKAREIEVDVEQPPAGMEEIESIIIELHPEEDERAGKGRPRAQITPGAAGAAPHLFGGVVLTAFFQVDDEPVAEPAAATTGAAVTEDEEAPAQRKRATMQVLPDGRILLHGPRDAVDELDEAIALFEEDLSRGEVIRIFKFSKGDVNAASRILDLMFNERQIRLPQQRQPQQPQQRGQRGKEGEGRDQQQGLMQQIQQMIGGRTQPGARGGVTGGRRVRIATDASHNYLIVKCDEALLPDIIQLLRELDIKPAEVDVKVFELKNLDAVETANNIKEVLGLTKARRRPTPQGRGRSPQQQLLEILQQQMVTIGGGVEGSAKIESVEIVANAVTNSLLVSAPPEVMTIIEEVIGMMEGVEGGGVVVIKHRQLKEAKVDDVLPLLRDIFSAAGAGRRGGSPADLGPVTISGDPRSNTIIFVAQAKDVDTIEEQIKRLDITGAIAEVEMYVCKYGDAVGIAQAVSEMFVTGAGRRGPRGRGAPQPGGLEIRITAEPATNTILVFAPEEKRELILAQIESLDRQNRFDIREIDVVFARPEVVADKLIQIFGGAGGSAVSGRRGPRGARGAVAQMQGRIVVVPDENSKKLLVRAPDEIFEKMVELVELLDQPSEQLLIRTFPLKHADAQVVVDSVKSALLEFMALQRQLGRGELDIDAFTAVADPRSNSVVVVGSEETFLFVQQLVDAIDAPTPAEQQKQFRVFVLDNVPAESVAEAINSFAAGGGAPGSAGRRAPSRRGAVRGMMPGVMGGGAILDVQAIAEPSSNAVMVYGRGEDIDRVETEVIRKMDGVMQGYYQFATLPVKDTLPTQLVSYIQPFLDQVGPQADVRGGRAGRAGDVRPGLQLLPNDNNNTITVYGSTRQIAFVTSLVERFDTPDTGTNQFELIPVPWGQDAVALAQQVEALVNDSERLLAERQGRQPRFITVQANPETNVIMVAGDPAQYAVVKTVVQQLKEIDVYQPVTRIIELVNLSSQEAQGFINDLQQQRRGGSSGTRGTSFRRSPGSRSRRSTPGRGSSDRSRFRGSRRRGWLWQPPQPNAKRYSLAPAGVGAPFIGTFGVSPLVLWMQSADQAESPADEPQTQPTGPLSTITGQLKGEVLATPLDARRIVVTGDAEDVEFIVQMLALMELKTPATEIRVFKLKQAKAASLAPMLEQAVKAYIETLSDTVGRVDRVSIIAEARGNSIIVTASEVNMTMIEEMIGELDFDAIADTQTKVVPLKHMQASEAAALVSEAWAELEKIRETPSNAVASIRAIDRSNSLLVVGTASDIADIERLVQGIDVELGEEEERFDWAVSRVVVLELKNAIAEDLAETLNGLIEVERTAAGQGGRRGAEAAAQIRKLLLTTADGRELPPLDLDRPIRILPEKGKNALIIFSTPKNNEALVEIAGLFDELPIGAEVEVKSFALEYANAEQVADLLQEMFDDAKKALQRPSGGDSARFDKGVLPPVPPGLAGRGLPYNVVVSHDARSNTVLVVGRKDAVLLAAGLITELDRPSVDLSIKPYVVQLRNIQATTLQEKLDDLLEKRLDALGSDKNEARDSAIIEADDRSNTLIVLATPEIFTMVEDLAVQLDRAEPYSVVDSEFRRLEYADAAKLAGLLQELFDKKKDAEGDVAEGGQKNVLFVFADARSNSLMLTGTRDYLLEANNLVDNLDQAFDPTVQFKLRSVRLNSAANIATLLEEMIQESRREQDREMQGTPIHVAADPYSNSLLLAASAEDMLMLERWIEVLDRPAEPGRITRIIPLRHGSAEELARSAQELFQTQAQGAQADVTVTHDETTNSVVAIGPPAVVKDIEDFVRKLNQVEGAGAVVKIFKLEEADAEDAGELLRSILEGRGGSVGGGSRGGGSRQEEFNQVMLVFQTEHPELGTETFKGLRSEVVVIDDLRTNSLTILAPPETMPLMESLAAAVDVPPDAAKIRVFKLWNSDAEEMVQMLEELFEQERAGARGGEDEEELRLELGEGVGEGGRQRLAFTVDARTNSVIAAGTTGYLDLVEELIVELDSKPIEERKTYVYHPRNNEAMAIEQVVSEFSDREQQLLDELAEEMSASERMRRELLVTASEETNRIIL
ncbi:MAG: secretin N-terminal domain-containing protein, partial [Phycisphaerae bacterium]